METSKTIDLKTMTKDELTTLLQKKIFQLGVNGLQQNDILRLIDQIETELARRKEENISQVKSTEGEVTEENSTETSETGVINNDEQAE